MKLTEAGVLETLRRVPDRIILATMGRDLDLFDPKTCLCGWFVREKLAEANNVGASEIDLSRIEDFDPDAESMFEDSHEASVRIFGGTPREWIDVFSGVIDEEGAAVVESAFAQRVDEAVNPPRRRRPRKSAGV